jgi:hypothetical protein
MIIVYSKYSIPCVVKIDTYDNMNVMVMVYKCSSRFGAIFMFTLFENMIKFNNAYVQCQYYRIPNVVPTSKDYIFVNIFML